VRGKHDAGSAGAPAFSQACLPVVTDAVPKVLELTAALRAKAKQLSKSSGRDWTPADVERCLYAASLAAAGSSGGARGAAGSSGGGKATGTKRKR
jgi:hypothetical protein